MEVSKIIAQNVAFERCKKNVTQSELARKLDISLVSMNRMENGHVLINTNTMKQIADILGVKFTDLCKGVDDVK